jgi:hypothetical protein
MRCWLLLCRERWILYPLLPGDICLGQRQLGVHPVCRRLFDLARWDRHGPERVCLREHCVRHLSVRKVNNSANAALSAPSVLSAERLQSYVKREALAWRTSSLLCICTGTAGRPKTTATSARQAATAPARATPCPRTAPQANTKTRRAKWRAKPARPASTAAAPPSRCVQLARRVPTPLAPRRRHASAAQREHIRSRFVFDFLFCTVPFAILVFVSPCLLSIFVSPI